MNGIAYEKLLGNFLFFRLISFVPMKLILPLGLIMVIFGRRVWVTRVTVELLNGAIMVQREGDRGYRQNNTPVQIILKYLLPFPLNSIPHPSNLNSFHVTTSIIYSI